MDPPPRSSAPPDAHACIMVLVPIDQPNTSLRRDISRRGRARLGSRPRAASRHLRVVASSLAPGSRPSRAASLRDGLRPPLTAAPPGRPAGLRPRRGDAGFRRTRRSLKWP